jgi:hypothetical protein
VKSVKNFRYVEKTSVECNEDSYLAILHLSRVELHCKCNMAFTQEMFTFGVCCQEEKYILQRRLF